MNKDKFLDILAWSIAIFGMVGVFVLVICIEPRMIVLGIVLAILGWAGYRISPDTDYGY
jgi:hypothetical protein